jgi:hypothetical protein
MSIGDIFLSLLICVVIYAALYATNKVKKTK